jgi:uncharacterized membrane protein YhhN
MVVPRAVSFLVLVTVSCVHLVAQLVAPDGVVTSVTQPMLMPALAAVLLVGTTAPRPLLVRVVLVALFFSWLGDTVPRFLDGDAAFGAMLGCFLLAQVTYIVAFRRPRHQPLAPPLALTVPYFMAYGALVSACFDGAGPLIVPVMVYGGALVVMAILATGLGRVGGIGGGVFMVSDSLIALHAFAGLDLPAHSFWVMLTYVVGQTLLVLAVRDRASVAARNPGLQSIA